MYRCDQYSHAQRVLICLGTRRALVGTIKLACASQFQNKGGEGLEWIHQQIEYTRLQFWVRARVVSSVVVVPTPTDPMGVPRDFKVRSATKEIFHFKRPMICEAAVAIQASKDLALVSVSRQHAPSSLVHVLLGLSFFL